MGRFTEKCSGAHAAVLAFALPLCACVIERADDSPASQALPAADPSAMPGSASTPTVPGTNPQANTAGASAAPLGGNGAGEPTPVTDTPTGEPIEPEPQCKGFEVRGLAYSPGGSVLPDTCKPYDPRTNNPFAIRCIDADPDYATGFPGDEFCILPPPPELGMQFGVHPKSYQAADTAGYVVQAGEETNQNYFIKAGNSQERYFFRSNVRMRTGSHHLITTGGSLDTPDGWEGDKQSAGIGILAPGFETTLPSAQRPDQNTPPGLDMPPEQAGLAFRLTAHQQIQFNLHHFNSSAEPILREVWINVWFMPAEEVQNVIQPLALIAPPADMEVPTGESRVLTYGCLFETARVIALTGHRHASTDRFSVWREQGGQNLPLYESFDYNDMPTYDYDSVTKNPEMNVAMGVDGAFSGPLTLENGTLRWRCEIHNRTDQTLTFSNELYKGEMCIVFGGYVGSQPTCDFGVLHYELLPLLGPLTDVFL
jgi:hypothetical protein